MNVLDIVAIVIIILGGLAGFKRGAIRGLVQLIGLVAIIIVSYQFKGFLGDIFIKYLPFFNFGGKYNELYSLNLLLYEGAAFAIIFVLLYCILNILIALSGVIDMLVKMTIILELPSKLIGIVLGMIESIIFIFAVAFTLLQFGQTQSIVMKSKLVGGIVERTPIVNVVFSKSIAASENIYLTVESAAKNKDKTEANISIIRSIISYDIVKANLVQECIDSGKLHLDNVVVAS